MNAADSATTRALPWQMAVLEGIARGKPLDETLDSLALLLESETAGFACGVCVLSPGGSVADSHGPHLPETFRAGLRLETLEDPGRNPCSLALRESQTVAVPDIANDPRWSGTPWRKLALDHGFRSCISSPIFGSDGKALGTFVLYSAKDHELPSGDFGRAASHLASIAIEKNQDESALRESEQTLRMAITGADLGTWDWNLTTGALVWSDRCKEMFGYPPETAMSYEVFLAAIHPEDRDRVNQAVKDALEGRLAYDIEYRTLWKDGTVRWISAKGSGFSEDGTGTPLFMRGIAVDITEHKEAEFRAVEGTARFQFLAESLPEKIFTTDARGETTYLNQQWAAYTGLSVEEVMRLGWREFVHPDDIDEKVARWTHAMEHGTPFEFEHRFRRADGEHRWHLSRAHPMRREDGAIAMWVGSNIDIDDLKRAQFELRESESRSRLAMESARLGFWDWDVQSNHVSWSPEHNRMFGMPSHILAGNFELAIEHIHPKDHAVVKKAMERALAERVDYEAEFRTVDDGGVVRWVAAHGRAYYDEQTAQAVRMIGVVRDVTERRRFEEQLRSKQEELHTALSAAELARKEAEAANSAKDQFLAVLSHELRTPLTPVLMAAAYIGRDKTLTPDVQEAMRMIQRNISLEARLIEDLLDITRITRNKWELHAEPMDLHTALRQAIEICHPDFEAKKQILHVNLAAAQSRIMGDITRLQQVFWNLLKNASKFTPAGGEIHIRTTNDGPQIIAEIDDSGMGIPATVLSRIFKPFEQGDKKFVREFGGLGLGLAISKATIDAHGGILEAASAGQNQGATFIVRLATEEA